MAQERKGSQRLLMFRTQCSVLCFSISSVSVKRNTFHLVLVLKPKLSGLKDLKVNFENIQKLKCKGTLREQQTRSH